MGSRRSPYAFNRWRFEGVFLAWGSLFSMAMLVSVIVYVTLPVPWGVLSAFGLVLLVFAAGFAVGLETRDDAR